ncbi:30S ribosomal protein S13 [Candidatus Falkowbacteria bacterium]|jgi:small subunit ribosomal protein S13|nr:30S ribosomal protein S13 [Candidatus Falkowbacteria bacterium]MBT4433550.1 30S ribosomal protein S13 [Candidatus Falkowbacteria bacterium]
MARIAGINLPKEKRVEIALTYIYGIGRVLSNKVLEEAGVDPSIRVHALSEEDENKLRVIIEKKYNVEGDLRRDISFNIKRYKEIRCFRGTRHAKGLPARGQRTKTNNRTLRGNKRSTMGSGRKMAAQKT